MILSKKNWFIRYYRWVKSEYPKDVCSLFWGGLAITLLAPVYIPGRLVSDKNSFGNGLGVWFCYILAMVIGIVVNSGFGYVFITTLQLLFVAPLFGAIGAAILAGLIRGIGQIIINFCESDVKENISDWVGAIKRDRCTRIKYKD